MNIDHAGRGGLRAVFLGTSLFVLLIAFASIFHVRASADEASNAPSTSPALPLLKSSKDIYYPQMAKQVGLEGKVLVAFDIAADGSVAHSSIIFADEGGFEGVAKEYLAGLQFVVPSNWANSPARYQRYHLGFVFCIPPSSLAATFEVAASPVTIKTNRIPGSPVRNPPALGAAGPCVS
jgi:TonB family protein